MIFAMVKLCFYSAPLLSVAFWHHPLQSSAAGVASPGSSPARSRRSLGTSLHKSYLANSRVGGVATMTSARPRKKLMRSIPLQAQPVALGLWLNHRRLWRQCFNIRGICFSSTGTCFIAGGSHFNSTCQ